MMLFLFFFYSVESFFYLLRLDTAAFSVFVMILFTPLKLMFFLKVLGMGSVSFSLFCVVWAGLSLFHLVGFWGMYLLKFKYLSVIPFGFVVLFGLMSVFVLSS